MVLRTNPPEAFGGGFTRDHTVERGEGQGKGEIVRVRAIFAWLALLASLDLSFSALRTVRATR